MTLSLHQHEPAPQSLYHPNDSDPRGARGQTMAIFVDNETVAAMLEEVADLLESQKASIYRVRAYRDGASVLRRLESPVARMLAEDGIDGLLKFPKIGPNLANAIRQIVQTGRFTFLEHLRGESGTEKLLETVPGIGPHLAAQIHDRLHIQTLADLETAAWNGRLATVPGMGRRRIRAVRESLAGRFAHAPVSVQINPEMEPPVAEILAIDEEYRSKAAAGELSNIAPRRFNPAHEAWLPVLHTTMGCNHYTALYSNTARAHQLRRTDDWVVIYRDDHDAHGRWTVVTARSGVLGGRRIVRGREEECAKYYETRPIAGKAHEQFHLAQSW